MNWRQVKLKYVASVNNRSLPETTDPDYEFYYVDIGAVSQGTIASTLEHCTFAQAPSRARREASVDDTVISTVRTYLRAVARVLPTKNIPTIYSTGFAVVHPKLHLLHPDYLSYSLQSDYFIDQVVSRSVGVSYPAINASEIMSLPIFLPPVSEQRAIADFLDRETAKIDALIAKQKQLIELLKERRIRVISQATTKGLERQSRLVDHNISWQGDVPEHWIVKPMKCFLQLKNNTVGEDWFSTQLLSLTKNGVIPRDADSGEGKYPASFDGYQLVEPGDLVWCLFDSDETPRTVGLSVDFGMITGAYRCFRVNEDIVNRRYLIWALIAIDDEKRLRPLYSGLRKVIQLPRLLSARLAFPPLDEQHAIADHLDRETAKIDTLITKTEESISLSQERRAALITAAVTGQIDVTNEED